MTRMHKVFYEVSTDANKASLTRFICSLIKFKGEIKDTLVFAISKDNMFSRGGTVVIYVKLNPDHVSSFLEEAKPISIKYKSPTYFDNGSLRPMYKSAEDEISDLPNRLEEIRKKESLNFHRESEFLRDLKSILDTSRTDEYAGDPDKALNYLQRSLSAFIRRT